MTAPTRFSFALAACAASLLLVSRIDAQGALRSDGSAATRPSPRARAEMRWRAEGEDLTVRDSDAVAIDHGAPAWNDAARAALKTRAWRWRAGSDGWTMLRTEGSLVMGDVRIRPGGYAVLVQCESGRHVLELVEERLLAGRSPSDLSAVPRGVLVPLEICDAPKAHRRLCFEFRADRRGGRSALNPPRRLVLGFGTAELFVLVSPDREDTVIGPPSAQAVARSSLKTGSADDAVRAASAAAARWLVEHQSDDGRWDSDGFPAECDPAKGPPCDGRGSMQRDARTTALAILVLLGEGGTHVDGQYADALRRGLGFLLRSQQPNGLVPHVEQTGPEQTTLTWTNGDHAIAAWALAEAWGASGSPRLRDAARAAITYLLEVRVGGAWQDHNAQEGGDMITTGWAASALAAARTAGDLEIPVDALTGALTLTASLTDEQSGRTGFDRFRHLTPRYELQSATFPPRTCRRMHRGRAARPPRRRRGRRRRARLPQRRRPALVVPPPLGLEGGRDRLLLLVPRILRDARRRFGERVERLGPRSPQGAAARATEGRQLPRLVGRRRCMELRLRPRRSDGDERAGPAGLAPLRAA
jgi:hypothetical protein